MSKEKTFINCERFDSYSKPCLNKDNKYIIIASDWFANSGRPISDAPAFINAEHYQQANKVCSECASFESYIK
jgi:hypothetical protein